MIGSTSCFSKSSHIHLLILLLGILLSLVSLQGNWGVEQLRLTPGDGLIYAENLELETLSSAYLCSKTWVLRREEVTTQKHDLAQPLTEGQGRKHLGVQQIQLCHYTNEETEAQKGEWCTANEQNFDADSKLISVAESLYVVPIFSPGSDLF